MWQIRILATICLALGVSLASASIVGVSAGPAPITPEAADTNHAKPEPGMLLVARRSLHDPHFGKSVVYLVEHDENGTLGLIVNRSSRISLADAAPDLEDERAAAYALHYGGPVGKQSILMLLRSDSAARGMAHVIDDVYISSDQRVLEQMLAAKKPVDELHFYIGYSGWGAGQLDFELQRDDWHVVKADTDSIFGNEADWLWYHLIERFEPSGIQVDKRQSPATWVSRKISIRESEVEMPPGSLHTPLF